MACCLPGVFSKGILTTDLPICFPRPTVKTNLRNIELHEEGFRDLQYVGCVDACWGRGGKLPHGGVVKA